RAGPAPAGPYRAGPVVRPAAASAGPDSAPAASVAASAAAAVAAGAASRAAACRRSIATRSAPCRKARWPGWCSCDRSSLFVGRFGCPAAAVLVDAGQGLFEVSGQAREVTGQRRPPPDDHIIMTGEHLPGGRTPHRLPEPPPHPIALHGGPYLPGYGEADPCRPIVVAPPRLEHERGARNLGARCHREEFAASPQPVHGRRRRKALRRWRPRARRAATTLRPPLVAMRARKPWRRLRTSLLGW